MTESAGVEFDEALAAGSAALTAGRLVEARSELERALRHDPANHRARNLYGLALFKQGELVRAEEVYRALIDDNPVDPTLRVNLGLVYLKKTASQDAVRCFETAIDLAPHHQKAQNYLGLALAQKGELSRAREWFVKAGNEAMAQRMAQALEQSPLREVAASAEAALDSDAPFRAASDTQEMARPKELEEAAQKHWMATAPKGATRPARRTAVTMPPPPDPSMPPREDLTRTSVARVAPSVEPEEDLMRTAVRRVLPEAEPASEARSESDKTAESPRLSLEPKTRPPRPREPSQLDTARAQLESARAQLRSLPSRASTRPIPRTRPPREEPPPEQREEQPREPQPAGSREVQQRESPQAGPEEDRPPPDPTAGARREPSPAGQRQEAAVPEQPARAPPAWQPEAPRSEPEPARAEPPIAPALSEPAPSMAQYSRSSQLSMPPSSGTVFAIGPTELLIHVSGEMLTRLDGLVASMGSLSLKPEMKRFRGKATDKPFGDGAHRMLRASGQGRFVLSRENRRFTALELGDEPSYFREEVLFAFEESILFENGRVPSKGGRDLHLVHLRGKGRLLLSTHGVPHGVEVRRGEALRIPMDQLVGWHGPLIQPRLVPMVEAAPELGIALELSGEGRALLDVPAAQEK